eukprot:jgi/Bigna1/137089/aug1.37_g11797
MWTLSHLCLLLLVRPSLATTCSTNEDCSLNGVCSGGMCSCFSGWQGNKCEILRIGKVDPAKIGFDQLGQSPPVSTLGASIIYDEGIYHLFAVEISRSCGFDTRGTNSRVVHAYSLESPYGPYTRYGTIFDVYATDVKVVRNPQTGAFVMYLSGRVNGGTTYPWAECECGTNHVGDPTATTAEQMGVCAMNASVITQGPLPTYMSYTLSPEELTSWSSLVKIKDPLGGSTDMNMQMSVAIEADGSVRGLFNHKRDCPTSANRCGVFGFVQSSDFTSPTAYQFSSDNIFGTTTYQSFGGLHDPHIWLDKNGNTHVIYTDVSDSSGTLNVKHAYNSDPFVPGGWKVSGTIFTNTYQYTDGTTVVSPICAKPSILLNDTNLAPIGLGQQPAGLQRVDQLHSFNTDPYIIRPHNLRSNYPLPDNLWANNSNTINFRTNNYWPHYLRTNNYITKQRRADNARTNYSWTDNRGANNTRTNYC